MDLSKKSMRETAIWSCRSEEGYEAYVVPASDEHADRYFVATVWDGSELVDVYPTPSMSNAIEFADKW